MKSHYLTLSAITWIACSATALAGTPTPDPVVPASSSDEWKVTSWAYGWLAGVEGTMGVKGFTSEVNIPFSSVLDHLDMTGSINLEAQKGRWGGWIDGMYLKVSAGGSTPDPLFNTVNLTQEQIVAEAAIFYRLWESQRGSLDLYAGARYMSVKGELSIKLSDAGVEQVSSDLSAKVIDEIISGVNRKAGPVLEAKRAQLDDRVAAKKAQVATQVAAKANAVLNDLKAIGESHPGLANAIKNSERLRQAIRNVASARIDQQLAAVQDTAAAVKDAVRAAAQAAARRAVAKAEKALANEIERALRNSIPSELSGTKDWVDPFIGLRGYYHFTDDFYAVAKADIGGFGISSDLAWQVYAALGYNLSKRTTLELGYKYMAVDYTSGGFTNDVSTSGAFLNLGLKL